MTTDLELAIRLATDQPRPADRAASLKHAVADSITRIDRTATPRFTEYFNHTWVPDMVIEWPREGRNRFVYLRSAHLASWWQEDLQEIDRRQAMMVTIDDSEGEPSAFSNPVNEASRASDTWITGIRGLGTLDSLASNDTSSAPTNLVTSALLKGGRGAADAPALRDLVTTTGVTFEAAAALVGDATRTGLTTLEDNLNSEQTGRFSRVLRAIWEGNGGDGVQFPSARSLGPLSAEDLNYLVDTLDHADEHFWRTIGRHLTTTLLASLSVDPTKRAFQMLVRSNLDRLTAKAIGVLVSGGLDLAEPQWGLTDGHLTLHADGYVFAFAQRREELVTRQAGTPVSLHDLRQRLGRADAVVEQVDLVRRRDHASAKFEVGESGDLLADAALSEAASAFGSDQVRSVGLRIPGSGAANVDMIRQYAIAPTNSMHPLDRLVRAIVPIFAQSSDIRAFIGRVRSEARDLPDSDDTLF